MREESEGEYIFEIHTANSWTRTKQKKPHIRQKAFQDRNFSPLEHHSRDGKKLKPPFSRIPGKFTLSSWKDTCIPNILWACILTAFLERDHYLHLFRQIPIRTRKRLDNYEDTFITHNHLSLRTEDEFDVMLSAIHEDSEALSFLSAMLLVETLPDRQLWARHLDDPDPAVHWDVLARAVAVCFDHQSQPSTDIRWLKLMHLICMGKLKFDRKMAERVEEFRCYPDKGDMRSVRPSIRAAEMTFRSMEFGTEELGQQNKLGIPPARYEEFWAECFAKTHCIAIEHESPPVVETSELQRAIHELYGSIVAHYYETISHTGVEPRHDAAFGLVLYAMALLFNASQSNIHQLAEGRVILRSIVETFITLRFLAKKDDETIWMQYRQYGSGQAKLSFLKNVREDNIPEFVNLEEIENLANEDAWLEFQDIPLGAWADKNLRQMAIESDCKAVYDAHFDWASGYVHGNWASVRDTVYVTCVNPLHRLHRIPSPPRSNMASILNDAFKLINRMLDELNHLYPSLKPRIRWHKQRDEKAV